MKIKNEGKTKGGKQESETRKTHQNFRNSKTRRSLAMRKFFFPKRKFWLEKYRWDRIKLKQFSNFFFRYKIKIDVVENSGISLVEWLHECPLLVDERKWSQNYFASYKRGGSEWLGKWCPFDMAWFGWWSPLIWRLSFVSPPRTPGRAGL